MHTCKQDNVGQGIQILKIFAERVATEIERTLMEEETKQNQQFLQVMLNHLPVAVFAKKADSGEFVLWNETSHALFGLTSEQTLGKTDYDFFPKEQADFFRQKDKETFNKGSLEEIEEEPIDSHSLGRRLLHTLKVPIFTEDGWPLYLLGISEDITEKKAAEQALKISDERLKLTLESTNDGIWDWNIETGDVYLSPRLERMLGFQPGEIEQQIDTLKSMVHPEDIDEVKRQLDIHLQGHSQNYEAEYRIHSKSGAWVWILDRGKVVERDANNCPLRAVGTHTDITPRKQVEEQLRVSLKEQELLLKELHHRVKNNLQLVSSLLEMQLRYTTDDSVKSILLDSQSRIITMGMVPELLYQSSDVSAIAVKDYLNRLTEKLKNAYQSDSDNVTLVIDADPIILGVDKALPCGLIVNELITNALNHAFPANQSGTIWINLNMHDAISLSLCVKDDGVGLPDDVDENSDRSLGLRLVSVLVQQLEGRMCISRMPGTRVDISFPLQPITQQESGENVG